MYKILRLAVVLLALIFISFKPSPSPEYNIEDVANALRSGNLDQLCNYLDYEVDISLPDKTDTYSKSQAQMIIRDFLTNHIVRTFSVKQKGSNEGSEFCIGMLRTRSGNYYTSIFMKQKGNKHLLEDLRFQTVQ